MTFQIQDAKKSLVKVRILMTGVSGSGKSLGGLYMAYGLIEKGQSVVVIDTESGSANDYADKFDPIYKVIPFPPPYTPEKYIEAIQYAVKSEPNIGVLVVDSITHEWEALKLEKDDYDLATPKGNNWTHWAKFTPRHDEFLNQMLHVPCHLIATARSKTEWVIEDKTPRKVGTTSKQREGLEYEFNIEFGFDHETNRFAVNKSRYAIDWHSEGKILNDRHGKLLYDYLHSGTNNVMSRTAMQDMLATIPVETRKAIWDNWDPPPGIEAVGDLDDEKYAEYYKLCTQEQAE